MSNLTQNYQNLIKEIGDVQLVAVTKKRSVKDIEALYKLGQRDFGENRVQELQDKAEQLKTLKDIRWHMIGPLQRNKVKQLLKIPQLYAIHSVSSLKLIEELNKYQHQVNIFLQVNTSMEDEKSGFETLEEIREAGYAMDVPVYGLMTMGKLRTDKFEADAQKCFQKLVDLKHQLSPHLKLSMGMSQDYHIALKIGTDYIRVGSKLFV